MRPTLARMLLLGPLVGSIMATGPSVVRAQMGVMFHNPQRSPDGVWSLFDSNRGGRQEIYVVRRDGSGMRALTDTPRESEGGARWEEDGRAITYTVGLAGHGQRYRLRLTADMTPAGPRKATTDESFIAWSPDHTRELFLRRPEGSHQQIFLRTGTEVFQLTEGTYGEQPSFSPDGTWIVYEIRPDDPPHEYVMLVRPDGSDRRRLSTGSDPSWSPGGDRILFKMVPDGGSHRHHQVVSVRPDGTDRRVYGWGAHPEWSPDGTEVSWMADRSDGGTDIMVAPAAGGRAECVTCSLH